MNATERKTAVKKAASEFDSAYAIMLSNELNTFRAGSEVTEAYLLTIAERNQIAKADHDEVIDRLCDAGVVAATLIDCRDMRAGYPVAQLGFVPAVRIL